MLRHTLRLTSNAAHQDQPTSNLKMVVRLLRNKELTSRVNIEHTVKLLRRNILHMAKAHDTRVRADDIELAELCNRVLEQLLDLIDLIDVGLDGFGFRAGFLDGADDLVGGLEAVGVINDDLCAAATELLCHCATDATTLFVLV